MRSVLGVIATGVLCALLLASCASPPGGVLVLPLNPTARSFGKNYAEWSVEWWRWALSLPVTGHPLFDYSGADAARGQTGSVWFLGGAWGDSPAAARTVTVPNGTALFFPLIAFKADSAILPGATNAELQDMADAARLKVTGLNLTVDGVQQYDLSLLRARSGPFSAPLPPGGDDIYSRDGIDAGGSVGTVFSDGYWAFIHPLPAGPHTISFGGVQTDGTDVYTQSATYNITVLP